LEKFAYFKSYAFEIEKNFRELKSFLESDSRVILVLIINVLVIIISGFHPNQISNALLAQVVWDNLKQNMSDWIPPMNPHNDQIAKMFGDQGGY